nr:MAG TPA: hypothetical protein [Caudoviricetes sp.]
MSKLYFQILNCKVLLRVNVNLWVGDKKVLYPLLSPTLP